MDSASVQQRLFLHGYLARGHFFPPDIEQICFPARNFVAKLCDAAPISIVADYADLERLISGIRPRLRVGAEMSGRQLHLHLPYSSSYL